MLYCGKVAQESKTKWKTKDLRFYLLIWISLSSLPTSWTVSLAAFGTHIVTEHKISPPTLKHSWFIDNVTALLFYKDCIMTRLALYQDQILSTSCMWRIINALRKNERESWLSSSSLKTAILWYSGLCHWGLDFYMGSWNT